MRIGLVAGEASGDLLGAGLIEALRERYPTARFEGVAGPKMRAAGCDAWESADALAVMGLVEPLLHLPRLLRLRRELRRRWITAPPDVFVGIDAPDFNLGLETALRRAGIPTVHYVSPSIWAWRAGRIRTIAKAVDRVLCLLPFEKALYDRHGVAADFVGHPMADRLPEHPDKAAARQTLGFGDGPVVAVLPGSRSGEVRRLAPIFAAAARHVVDAVPDAQFVTPVAAPGLRTAIVAALDAAGLRDRCVLLEGRSEDAMTAADVVLLASGTAALESALLGRPTVAAYRLAPMSYAIVKGLRLLRLTHVTLPNLLTETPLVPEFLQSAAQPAAIGDTVVALLRDPARRACIRDEFAKLRSQLARDTDRRAADAVASLATG